MISQASVLLAAKEIRPYLSELLTAVDAKDMSQRLDLIFSTELDPALQSTEIQRLMSTAETTQEWLKLYLEGKPSEQILPIIRTYQPLPGKAKAIASPRYRCPVANCHQVWYRRDVEETPPNCPIHDVPMVRDSKVTAK
ncbi:hypothetical protein PN498_22570 [Oscillatoria sp. CS-180]|uniref:hypothetical protein n=1 Tax=Oscillatoria sp. CS-180 TaxID=3021720 RepID=UPI00232E6612|nr:hypothetical protein [Oscillatoria sp. CS-180]MDB9528794.1 hypothetical protein [Oscillatoria sp. CS-180]